MNLEIRHLRLVQAIAEEGSVTKAGSKLYLTQSALSHQLKDAEDKLGTPLFTRINKRMLLTPAGERLLGSAQKVLDELGRAEEDVRQIALNREGVLRLCTECYTCYHWLPSLLSAFGALYPRIEVQIVADASEEPDQAIVEGKVDLALVSTSTKNSKVSYRPLFKDEMVVIMSNDHRLSSRTYIKAEDFIGEHLLTYSGIKDNFAVEKVLAPAGVAPGRVSSLRLTEAIIEMAKAGAGIAVLATWAIRPHIESGAIKAIPLTRKGLYRSWSAATLKNNAAPPYIGAFIELLASNKVLITEGKSDAKRGTKGNRIITSVECMSDSRC